MNTIEGLKALPNVINNLLDQRDAIQEQIDACYKPFRDIIEEVFCQELKSCYIDDIDIGVGESKICFALRYSWDDECEGTYSYPIESFVSAQTLRKYISDQIIEKQRQAEEKKEALRLAAETQREKAEKEMYLTLKKKFEGA
jgi:hypothetical protein